jgi:hypothetical protein
MTEAILSFFIEDQASITQVDVTIGRRPAASSLVFPAFGYGDAASLLKQAGAIRTTLTNTSVFRFIPLRRG